MAKRKVSPPDMAVYREPSPSQERDYAIDRAAEKAALAHPRTQKLREMIKQRMMKAAGNGENGAATPKKSASKAKKT